MPERRSRAHHLLLLLPSAALACGGDGAGPSGGGTGTTGTDPAMSTSGVDPTGDAPADSTSSDGGANGTSADGSSTAAAESSESSGGTTACVLGDPIWSDVDSFALDVAVVDLDNDHVLDVVLAGGSLSLLFNRGDGVFGAPTDFGLPAGFGAVASGDFNGDDKVDLMLASRSALAELTYWQGAGVPGFTQYGPYPVDGGVRTISAADLDLDGDLDVVVPVSGTSTLQIAWNDGGMEFALDDQFPTAGAPYEVVPADVDGDGLVDLVYGEDGGIGVRLNDGEGHFDDAPSWVAGSGVLGILVADLDGDGDADIAAAVGGDDTIGVLRNAGDGSR
ncbi:MAG: VCBS repeat-containing protein, partial [Myxococcales bacterium]|nr:VCBS repeat-containing protein [Myxococcales bacterium]